MLFPSSHINHGHLGVRHTFIQDGTATTGQVKNANEASAVVNQLVQIAEEFAQPAHRKLAKAPHSVGIIAMNIHQQETIKDLIDAKRTQDPFFDRNLAFLEAHETEPFFVRNLENVQGDERDVIIIRALTHELPDGYRETFLPAEVDEKASDTDKKSAASYNEALAGVPRQAEQYAFGQIDEQGAADLAHKAALYEFTMHHGIPRIASLYGTAISQRDSRIAELEGQVKALSAASPRLDGGSGGQSLADAPTQSESHLDAARKYFLRQ